MSDRKYRQRGIPGLWRRSGEKIGEALQRRKRTTRWAAAAEHARDADRFALCRVRRTAENLSETVGQCKKCGFELHSCKQCEHFDPSSRFECNQPIAERISPKDKRNDCKLFSMRVRLEKETSSKQAAAAPTMRAQAFENLFKRLRFLRRTQQNFTGRGPDKSQLLRMNGFVTI